MLAPLARAEVCAFALSCVAQARPIVIENGITLTPPASYCSTDSPDRHLPEVCL